MFSSSSLRGLFSIRCKIQSAKCSVPWAGHHRLNFEVKSKKGCESILAILDHIAHQQAELTLPSSSGGLQWHWPDILPLPSEAQDFHQPCQKQSSCHRSSWQSRACPSDLESLSTGARDPRCPSPSGAFGWCLSSHFVCVVTRGRIKPHWRITWKLEINLGKDRYTMNV